jgi:poly-gamma-glutamate capsule biosynthesis protein CapA/YwtB (metallophosphatase superfamily)
MEHYTVAPVSILVALALLAAPEAPPEQRVEIIFGGDVIPHDAVKQTAKDHDRGDLNHAGWDHVFGPIADQLRSADVAFVNLETPIVSTHKPLYAETTFSAPPVMAQSLAAAGVDVVSFANNHARDQGPEGVIETVRHLEAAHLAVAGAGRNMAAAWKPAIVERRGVKVGFIAVTRWLNDYANPGPRAPYVDVVRYAYDALPNTVSSRYALKQIKKAAAQCDVLVVSVHWGDEYTLGPRQGDREFAYAALEAGAAVVVGHHPHVLQPAEGYTTTDGRSTLVLYSMGNLVSNQSADYRPGGDESDGNRRDSMLARVTVVRRSGKAEVEKVSILPMWIENRRVAATPDSKKKELADIQPVLIDRELEAIDERLNELEARKDPAVENEIEVLLARRVQTARRRELIGRVIAEEYLGPAPERSSPAAGAIASGK